MTPKDIGTRLVELIKAGKSNEAIETLYAPDIVSVEAASAPDQSAITTGLAGCLEKGKQFRQRMEVHHQDADGPYPNGDRFAVLLRYDVTPRAGGPRTSMSEIAVYTVKDDKIVREEFFYSL
jgi:hypothetical protein